MASATPYNWADDENFGLNTRSMRQVPTQPQPAPQPQAAPRAGDSRATRAASAAGAGLGGFVGAMGGSVIPPVSVNVNAGGRGNNGGGNNGGKSTAGQAPAGGRGGDVGDRLVADIKRIEFRSEKDILAMAQAVNRLGRELHFVLSMRAEEIQAVLSTYKGKWYTFGASSRVKARLVAMHLKVSAEAAKALGVGSLKMAHAFDRHFIKPEQEAQRKRNGQPAKQQFTIGDA